MTRVEIRKLREEEIAPCAEMVPRVEPWVTLGANRKKMREYFRKRLERDEGFVALLRAEIVGFITIKRDFLHGCYIRRLAVKEEHRGKGIGSRIVAFVEDYAFARYPNVFLCVSSSNPRARSFYEGLGYQKVGELPDLILEGHSEYLLRKTQGAVSSYDGAEGEINERA